MNKIAIAITGASGAIYAKLLIEKLLVIKDQWNSLGIVMSNTLKKYGKQN
jgi:4-hydroxy-3-polyprenylbenzoate decarboxylase